MSNKEDSFAKRAAKATVLLPAYAGLCAASGAAINAIGSAILPQSAGWDAGVSIIDATQAGALGTTILGLAGATVSSISILCATNNKVTGFAGSIGGLAACICGSMVGGEILETIATNEQLRFMCASASTGMGVIAGGFFAISLGAGAIALCAGFCGAAASGNELTLVEVPSKNMEDGNIVGVDGLSIVDKDRQKELESSSSVGGFLTWAGSYLGVSSDREVQRVKAMPV